ncbi:hypothetical protein BVRB_7g163910 [Beta vulgaris subsp. vulgaris]|uniref:protein TILLER ANGLE CONTROL 1 isoform X2 n=1 Tax=Beta vulgaris subsp. vulgaris TaxID=3555 RepID=UPI00053FC7DB|nr:protein TILLER ANGLE CONTROL 1 isoform X2 [Beta vulgaris subsp. vulgaris]KMT06068.1 hypothetical protein BVRB_7g163910 [Beta vulgaris subsp. vulgaris]
MKVFNWVHQRFLNAHSCTGFLQENAADKNGSLKIENEKHLLLEHNAHMVVEMQMLDHWKDGILSIGTLAIGPLEDSTFGSIEEVGDGHHHDHEITDVHNHDVNDDDDHEGDDDDNDHEASPLMDVEFFSHELEKVIGANHEIVEEVVADNVVHLRDNNFDEGQTKRRVTLAELFLEEYSDYHPVKTQKELEDGDDDDDDIRGDYYIMKEKGLEMSTKPTFLAKNGLSKAKKLLKEDLHPVKKFNQLMKRMMKKKIHPDLEGKKDMQMHPNYGRSSPTNDQDPSNNELASLLLIQDAMV